MRTIPTTPSTALTLHPAVAGHRHVKLLAVLQLAPWPRNGCTTDLELRLLHGYLSLLAFFFTTFPFLSHFYHFLSFLSVPFLSLLALPLFEAYPPSPPATPLRPRCTCPCVPPFTTYMPYTFSPPLTLPPPNTQQQQQQQRTQKQHKRCLR